MSGIGELSDGGNELKDGMKKFNDEGIQKLTDVMDGDLGNILDRLNRLADLSKNYNSFTGISDEMDGEVKFIIETEGIEKE